MVLTDIHRHNSPNLNPSSHFQCSIKKPLKTTNNGWEIKFGSPIALYFPKSVLLVCFGHGLGLDNNQITAEILTKNCEENLFRHWITHTIVCCAHVTRRRIFLQKKILKLMKFHLPAWEVVMLCKDRELPLELQKKYWSGFLISRFNKHFFLVRVYRCFSISIFAFFIFTLWNLCIDCIKLNMLWGGYISNFGATTILSDSTMVAFQKMCNSLMINK